MSVLVHIGKIFKDSPMRRFFRGKHKAVTKNEAASIEEGHVEGDGECQGEGHSEGQGQVDTERSAEHNDLDASPDQGHSDPERSEVSWFDAIKEHQTARVKQLIEQGCDVNATDEHGWSALHISAWNDYCEQCCHLVAAGGDVNMSGPGNSTALSLAAQRGHVNTVQFLLTSHCDVSRVSDLADSRGVTALHLAAQHGHADVVRLLVDAGAVVNVTMTTRGINGVTPLHLAVQNDHLDVMDILIGAGCDVHSSTQAEEPSDTGSTEAGESNTEGGQSSIDTRDPSQAGQDTGRDSVQDITSKLSRTVMESTC